MPRTSLMSHASVLLALMTLAPASVQSAESPPKCEILHSRQNIGEIFYNRDHENNGLNDVLVRCEYTVDGKKEVFVGATPANTLLKKPNVKDSFSDLKAGDKPQKYYFLQKSAAGYKLKRYLSEDAGDFNSPVDLKDLKGEPAIQIKYFWAEMNVGGTRVQATQRLVKKNDIDCKKDGKNVLPDGFEPNGVCLGRVYPKRLNKENQKYIVVPGGGVQIPVICEATLSGKCPDAEECLNSYTRKGRSEVISRTSFGDEVRFYNTANPDLGIIIKNNVGCPIAFSEKNGSFDAHECSSEPCTGPWDGLKGIETTFGSYADEAPAPGGSPAPSGAEAKEVKTNGVN